jgi:hypothetical protein
VDYVASGLMLFAVPAHAVRDHEEQEAAWLWYGDTLIDCREGFFVIGEDGCLEFEPRDDGAA